MTNLRAVLDHAIYFHVMSRITLAARQISAVKFPICEDRQQWNSWNGQPLSRQRVSASFRDAIESVQPVTASVKDPRHATLYALNELVNIDKHRACHVVAYSGEATFDRDNDPLGSGFMRTSRGTLLADGAVIATKKFLRPLPGSGTTARIDFKGLAGYTEVVDLPNVGPLLMLGLCDIMVDRVAEVLTVLEQAH